ncbi:hypothetical protein CERSUDRAFT_83169 [Gelatoporia subvermispora B]|uniref:Uncharacterized protein n=1 Tax=Ceriporiopsis subvermispora (strain B) TaxID=914234 RepID=M2RF10_CERS8|nr:hypothetical protein CERSUDRAFT_83169 [Gelatoporia subvermispora B]
MAMTTYVSWKLMPDVVFKGDSARCHLSTFSPHTVNSYRQTSSQITTFDNSTKVPVLILSSSRHEDKSSSAIACWSAAALT